VTTPQLTIPEVSRVAVSGRLSEMSLPDVLQWAGVVRKSGALQLETEQVATQIFVRDGRIVGCASDDPPTLLGQFLLFQGAITESTLRQAMERQESTGKMLSKILIEMGSLTPEEMDKHLAAKARETILSLFEWQDATFRFCPGLTPGPRVMAIDVGVEDLLLQGMKRLDDKNRIREVFQHPGIVPRRTTRIPLPSAIGSWSNLQIYFAVDGKRALGEIVLRVHGTEFQVMNVLFGLLDGGFVEIADPRPQSAIESASPPTLPKPGMPSGAPEAPLSDLEATLRIARAHVERKLFEEALEVLGPVYRQDPNQPLVGRMLKEAEAGLVARIAEDNLPPHKVPVLNRSRDGFPSERLSPAEEYLLNLSDGSWDIRSLIWIVPMRTADLLMTLKRLVENGTIELRDPDPS
jgi:uncharacterized protein DUF4388